ncbi:hypothetical protein POPTR_019G089900v4 [Populus trichocarpa]|uniref:Uncharacterized protein n=2 Tax=Populus trichocarpa TaxID=3694 RepID=A0A3N7GA28_POPTR|nr:uncharacterized protein LOC7494597 isoform X1 [Populus trichocarpa]XP_024446699.1 uncharacterized protein LOC7494597 isoform X1 [Populus trichocarpa]XP_024446700.1 uncharacterized protein LOC7494597 isoform X1 [Populus trichocarpa]XP_052305666.1 uncharacterized protein LOC7494597 isoform X1 [Populus trichocarpa]RQP03633.1 hypothetical protein POPTR_019G089900v4 [Populus trichocarpa]RQP03636.1 hypothetical protein POPTR_019G089900v4 [Populus trichocarpa]|eukprot:XP_024446698.1 uncharacterized protein LOC7494597 isoform X1 [Populus trichocarpa]
MTIMDLKGITWVGDIYLKFEARLLEVEEIMREEAVKYVENQMQTVSNNVRKFYSDVMQDLCSPDSEDPANGAVSKFPVDSGADVGIYMKPEDGMEEKCGKADDPEQLAEDPKMTADSGSDCLPLRRRITVRRISRQHSKGSLSNKSNLDTDKNSNCNNVSPNEISGTTTLSSKFSSNVELSDQNLEASCDQTARLATPGCVEVTDHFSMEESKNEIKNASKHVPEISFNKPSLDMVNITETGRHEGTDSRPSSRNLLEESNGVCISNEFVSMIESAANGNMQTNKFAYEEDFVSNSDEWGIESDEDGTIIDEGMEIIRADKARLEEVCVLVNVDEFHHVPREGKNRPYKKIRDVFRSRKRSVMKEYEQLAAQCSSDSKSKEEESITSLMPTLSIKEANRSLSHDPSESEWELV